MNVQKKMWPLIASLLLVGFFSFPASAAVVYDNGGPSNDTGWNFSNPSSADDFMLNTNTLVDGVRFWAYTTGSAASLSQIGWAIMDDNAGLPGNILDSGVATPTSIIDTLVNLSVTPIFDIYEVVFSITQQSLLAGTTYWLALDAGPVFQDNPPTSDPTGWVFTAGFLGNQSVPGGPGNWIANNIDQDNAFQLLATVPEPSTVSLLGLSLAGFAFARRCRKKAA